MNTIKLTLEEENGQASISFAATGSIERLLKEASDAGALIHAVRAASESLERASARIAALEADLRAAKAAKRSSKR